MSETDWREAVARALCAERGKHHTHAAIYIDTYWRNHLDDASAAYAAFVDLGMISLAGGRSVPTSSLAVEIYREIMWEEITP